MLSPLGRLLWAFASALFFLSFLAVSPTPCQADQDTFPIELKETELLRGPESEPRGVIALKILRDLKLPTQLRLLDAEDRVIWEETPERIETGTRFYVPVPLPAVGKRARATLVVAEGTGESRGGVEYSAPSRDWGMHFIPGFHYDPVWWNTQAHYTETGYLSDQHVGPGLSLVEEYLDICRKDPDYRVALHQLPYLKTFFEARPDRSADLRQALKEGRCCTVGGTYNELSTTLISAETTARSAIYGTLFQREVLGGDASVCWQCDVFGHDPSFPSLMAQSGHTSGAFARGPFHQWGIDRDQVNFPSEFLWMSPDGNAILTHYMTGHYGYAYQRFASGTNVASNDPQVTEQIMAEMFEDLRIPALTHQILLPMHTDFVRPLKNLGDIVRAWNQTYISPRAIISTPTLYFEELRKEIADKEIVVPVITRDMNPIYTGCPVSFADLKLAQRASEIALRDAELLATIASFEGTPYPGLALDRAWRQLLFNSHHDGVTGSMSDQVYLDTLASYRDAWSFATEVRDRALRALVQKVPGDPEEEHVVWNTLARPRGAWRDERLSPVAEEIPYLGCFSDLPAVGYVVQSRVRHRVNWDHDDPILQNEHLRVVVDLERGGTLSSLYDLDRKQELLKGAGNDVVLWEEYPVLPGHGEGPWHLAPTGKSRPGTEVKARQLRRDPRQPHQIIIEADYPQFTKRQTLALYPGEKVLHCTTEILDWKGSNTLLRVEFPFDLPQARPVFQTAAAVIGRPFAREVDSGVDPWTLDQTCWQWVDLGSVCNVLLTYKGELQKRQAIGVGEIIVGQDASRETLEGANRLAQALVAAGVTTTITRYNQRRYGDIELDSNVPDIRFGYSNDAEAIATHKNQDLKWLAPSDDIPWLLIPAGSEAEQAMLEELGRDHTVSVELDGILSEGNRASTIGRGGVAIVNRGPVSVHISEEGTVALNLMRSCTSWPSGLWIDPPQRRLPDGAPFGTMHGTHRFSYAIVPHGGDYRQANLSRIGQQIQHGVYLEAPGGQAVAKPWPRSRSYFEIDNDAVLLTAYKRRGNAEAGWSPAPAGSGTSPQVVARLWNGSGKTVKVKLRQRQAMGAYRSDLLESVGDELAQTEAGFELEMKPHETVTVLFVLARRSLPNSLDVPLDDPLAGETSPSAYWLENLGEGSIANGVVSLVPAKREWRLEKGGARIPFTVINNHQSEALDFQVEPVADSAYQVAVDSPSLRLPPQSQKTVWVSVRETAPLGYAPLTVNLKGFGQWSVTGSVWLRGSANVDEIPDPASVPSTQPAVVDIEVSRRVVSAGDNLRCIVRNRSDVVVRGTATWLTPMQLWPLIDDWRRPLVIPPRGEVVVETRLPQSTSSFAMLKFAHDGRLAYSESIALLAAPEDVLLSFGIDRVRLRDGEEAQVSVKAQSVKGLTATREVTLQVPQGWRSREVAREFDEERGELTVTFAVAAAGERTRGQLVAVGPRGSRSEVSATVSPQQIALYSTPRLGNASDDALSPNEIRIDGNFDDWTLHDFTRAEDALGTVEAAVRYSTVGLVVAMRVVDDKFVQTHTGATLWQGDSVQIGLSASPSNSMGYRGGGDLEFGAALTPAGPIVWCWYAGEGGRTGLVPDSNVAIRREGNQIFYEFLLPRSILRGVPLDPGSILGFSYIANDDDGVGYRGATEWTPGMTGTKDASLFGDLVLEK